MQVKVAKSAGFCFGVQRAVDTVYEQVEKGIRPIYTYGPIIHNEVVVQDLEEKGVRVLDSKEELEALTEGTVIIRSHGVGIINSFYRMRCIVEPMFGGKAMGQRNNGQAEDPDCGKRECSWQADHYHRK